MALTLNTPAGSIKFSRFLTDSQPIPSQFSADFGFNTIESFLKTIKKAHNQENEYPNHISHILCSCNLAKIIRAKEMGISHIEWSNIWERI